MTWQLEDIITPASERKEDGQLKRLTSRLRSIYSCIWQLLTKPFNLFLIRRACLWAFLSAVHASLKWLWVLLLLWIVWKLKKIPSKFISRVLWLCKCLTYSSVLSKLRNSFDCVSVWFSLSVRVGDIGITISGGNCAEFGSTAFFNHKRQWASSNDNEGS